MPIVARIAARIEAAAPFPRLSVVRVARALRDRADVHIAIIDEPAFLADVRIEAAGEGGHGRRLSDHIFYRVKAAPEWVSVKNILEIPAETHSPPRPIKGLPSSGMNYEVRNFQHRIAARLVHQSIMHWHSFLFDGHVDGAEISLNEFVCPLRCFKKERNLGWHRIHSCCELLPALFYRCRNDLVRNQMSRTVLVEVSVTANLPNS
jgi:hypothetical protein